MLASASTGSYTLAAYDERAGTFAFTPPPGKYAIAVTSQNQYAYVEATEAPGAPTVTLSSDCYRVTGQITGAPGAAAVVWFARLSRKFGDRFAAVPDAHGQVTACLPDGTYRAIVDGAATSFPIWIRVAADTTVALPAYVKAQLEASPRGAQLANEDLPSFAQAIRGHTVIGMAEANHGTAEFFTYRAKLALELARAGNLRAILLEADAIAMFAIDDYVMGAEVDVAQAVVALNFWITDVREFLAALADLRAYNAHVAAARKVHVLGIDAQRLEPPVALLLAHRVPLAISEREADLLSRIAPDHGKPFTAMSDDDRTTLLAALDRWARTTADITQVAGRAAVAAKSIRLQLGYLVEPGIDALRDPAMAELAQQIIALTGAKQVAVWAHLGHLSRIGRYGARSLGEHLAERFAADYYPIAFLSFRGAARAWDAGGQIGVIPHALAPAPAFSLEAVLRQATGAPEVAWVRLDQANPVLQRWLDSPRYVREFGSAYQPGDAEKLHAFPAEFPAVVVLDHTSPTTPTPTGVRCVGAAPCGGS
ncbi:MAG TPA: erythromycin esterase family protein [Kofleriaceae bacterium]|nr:erythromycin esterase family protein [Kofleriaceae bacterium]